MRPRRSFDRRLGMGDRFTALLVTICDLEVRMPPREADPRQAGQEEDDRDDDDGYHAFTDAPDSPCPGQMKCPLSALRCTGTPNSLQRSRILRHRTLIDTLGSGSTAIGCSLIEVIRAAYRRCDPLIAEIPV